MNIESILFYNLSTGSYLLSNVLNIVLITNLQYLLVICKLYAFGITKNLVLRQSKFRVSNYSLQQLWRYRYTYMSS